jgi:hypothetical protein
MLWLTPAGSNNASVHGSNTERSSDPSAETQEHSGLSTSDLNYPGERELPGAGAHALQVRLFCMALRPAAIAP